MRRIGRFMYRLIYWSPPITLFMVMFVVGVFSDGRLTERIAGYIALPLAIWLVLGRWIARWLTPYFVSTVRCPGCGDDLDPVAVWNCSCGYHDHRERHILARICPQCGESSDHFNCPRCAATILLW